MSDFNVSMSLNGSVHSQGIKIDYRAWLDMGSEEWKNTSDEQKAAAYQAAMVCGWTDGGLKALMVRDFAPRVDQFTADLTIDTLRDLSKTYPVPVDQVYEVKKDNPRFKVRGLDDTFQLPG